MVNQVSIHVKLDNLNYAWLKQEALRTGLPANRIVNRAVALYVQVMQSKRHAESFDKTDGWYQALDDLHLTVHRKWQRSNK